jgi:hypothetical protein
MSLIAAIDNEDRRPWLAGHGGSGTEFTTCCSKEIQVIKMRAHASAKDTRGIARSTKKISIAKFDFYE